MPVETAHAQAVRERADDRAGMEVPDDAPVWVGVAQSPPGWFERRVDVVHSVLGLPAETREALSRRRRDLRMQGVCAEGAHNAAWAELAVDDRYRNCLSREESRAALESVAALAARGTVVLATDRRPGFRCHRTVLAAALEADGAGASGSG
jgi:hypothetical protein